MAKAASWEAFESAPRCQQCMPNMPTLYSIYSMWVLVTWRAAEAIRMGRKAVICSRLSRRAYECMQYVYVWRWSPLIARRRHRHFVCCY